MAISLHDFLTAVQAQAVGGASHKWKGICRSHDDTRNSLRIELASSGKLLVYCDVCSGQGKSKDDLVRGLKDASLWPVATGQGRPYQLALSSARASERKKDTDPLDWVAEPSSEIPAPRQYAGLTVAAVHVYRTLSGKVSGCVIRYHSATVDRLGKPEKEFRPLFCFRVDGEESWRTKAPPNRPLYGLEKLGQKDKAVLLVEGEKTADKAQEIFPHLIVLSAFGGLNGFQRTDIRPLADRDVIIWPDHDNNWQANLRAWIGRLAPEGRLAVKSLRTVTLNSTLPEKWDLADPIPDGVDVNTMLTGATLYVSCPDSVSNIRTLTQLEAGLYYVVEASGIKFVWSPTKVEFQPATFDQQFGYLRNDMGNIRPSVWATNYTRQNSRQCFGRVYEPINEVMIQSDSEMVYNSYLDPKIPAIEGNVAIWTNFLKFLLGEEQAHLFNCPLANLMQHGHDINRKCRYAMILVGSQGIGKSIALSVYERLVGPTNFSRPTTAEIEDRFNSFASNVQVINLVELAGSSQAYHRLMDVIADDKVRIHKKNLEPRLEKNFCMVIGSSNEMVPIKILDETERRWLFMKCKATVVERNLYDYERVLGWIESHLPQLKYFYKNYDLGTWEPNKLPSFGIEAKQEIAFASMPPYEQEYVASLNGKFFPLDRDVFTKGQFSSMVALLFKMRNEKIIIKKHGGGFLKGLVPRGGGLRTEEVYVIRNLSKYQEMSSEDLGKLTSQSGDVSEYM